MLTLTDFFLSSSYPGEQSLRKEFAFRWFTWEMIPGVSNWKHLSTGSHLLRAEGCLREVNSPVPGPCKHPCPVNSCGCSIPLVSEKHHGKPKICLKQGVAQYWNSSPLCHVTVTTATIANRIRRSRGSKTGHRDHLIQSTPASTTY